MTYIRAAILALVLSLGLAPALAQVPAPVPALPDTERRTSYSISGTTCACAVNFALYGDSTDFGNWVEVFINGVRYDFNDASHGWTITSPSGSLGTLARPITNAVLTFNAVQTGTVQIVGARRPRRTLQFAENQGVSARNLNQVFTDIISQNREIWDKTNDMTGRGLFGVPGETISTMPPAATRAGKFLFFDGTGLIPQFTTGATGTGNVVGAASSTDNALVRWDGTTGLAIQNSIALLSDSGTLTLAPTAASTTQGISISQSAPTTGSAATFSLNTISVTQDAVNNTGGGTNQNVNAALQVTYSWGGANAQGAGRTPIIAISQMVADSPLLGNNGPLALVTLATTNFSAGGTNTGAGAAGAVAGANIQAQLFGGAQNYRTLTGLEVDSEMFLVGGTGATVKSRWGIASVSIGTTASGGVTDDAAFVVWAGPSAPPWKNYLYLSAIGGNTAPLASTACMWCIDSLLSQTVATGVDFHLLTITGNAFQSPGFSVSGTGVTTNTLAPASNTSADGMILTDNTAASAGNQQFSPRIRLTGQGWKTAATAASQRVDWIIENQPIQDTTSPQTNLVFSSQVNNAGYAKAMQLQVNAVSGTEIFRLDASASAQIGIFINNANTLVNYADATQVIMGAVASVPLILNTNNTARITIGATTGDATLNTGSVIMGVATKTLVLKQGANGTVGTFVCNGATPVTVNNTNVAITDSINISLNTVGGTVGAYPTLKTITAASGFTVACTAADTSTMNYSIIKNAA